MWHKVSRYLIDYKDISKKVIPTSSIWHLFTME
jgi:hypothetical protein